MLPSDPDMLMSFLNLKLRDNYSSLEEMCDDLDIDYQDALAKIANAGLVFNEISKQYKRK